MAVAFSVLIFVLFVVAIIDAITIDKSRVKFLDRFFWIVIVILIPAIGSLLWFIFGREYVRAERVTSPQQWSAPTAGSSVPTTLSDTEQQLADLEREIAADRLRALEDQLRAKRERDEHNSCSDDPESGATQQNPDDTGSPA